MQIGVYKIMQGIGYLTINNQGTIKKMGRVKWYYALVLQIEQCIHGHVKYSLVEKYVKNTENKNDKNKARKQHVHA
jgi:hypothetical protein